jgi:hypothetical protein
LAVVRLRVLLVGYIAAMCGTGLPAPDLVLVTFGVNPLR